MRIYRVVAAVNIGPGHFDGYAPGDPLASVTARGALGPIVFGSAEDTAAVLDEMWVLGNRVHDACRVDAGHPTDDCPPELSAGTAGPTTGSL